MKGTRSFIYLVSVWNKHQALHTYGMRSLVFCKKSRQVWEFGDKFLSYLPTLYYFPSLHCFWQGLSQAFPSLHCFWQGLSQVFPSLHCFWQGFWQDLFLLQSFIPCLQQSFLSCLQQSFLPCLQQSLMGTAL